MTATVADYRVLTTSFRLRHDLSAGIDLEHSIGIQLDEGYVAGTKLARPIIQFMVRAFQDNSRLVIAVNNGVERDQSGRIRSSEAIVLDREFDTSPVRTFYVVVNGNRFSASSGNSLMFAINANSGDDILIENVVLWHQRRVAT